VPAITGCRSVLNRLIDKAIAACGAVAMASIVGMGVLRGGVEAVEYLMFLTALFAAPWVLRHNAHIRVDFLLENAPRRIALVFEVAINLIGLVVVGIFISYAARIGLQSAEEERKIYKNFIFPEWWIYAAASLALAMLWIEFLRRILRPFGGRQSQAQTP
jgi:TRAP-type C4-dicarboxylate transport system permease small subunit